MEYLICDMATVGVDVEVYLNDIPISRLIPGTGGREARPVNHLLVEGENRLGFLVKPGQTPAQARGGQRLGRLDARAHTSARLSGFPAGAFPGEDRGREVVLFEHAIESEREVLFPYFVERPFQYEAGRPDWAWQASPRLTLDPNLQVSVLSLLTKLVDSLQSVDARMFLDLASTRFVENALAYGGNPVARKKIWEDGLRALGQKPNWLFARPSLENMSLRLCADSRMVECIAIDWRPIVRAQRSERGVYMVHYPLLLASVGGRMQIVR